MPYWYRVLTALWHWEDKSWLPANWDEYEFVWHDYKVARLATDWGQKAQLEAIANRLP